MIKICEDAGHFGKYNQSPANKMYYESEAMWKLHLMRKKYLEEYEGVEVITTRDNQATDLGLTARGRKAKSCDLFISDHSNAVGSKVNESVDYVAVYHLTDDTTTKCDDESKEIAEKLAPVIARVMGTNQGYKITTRKSSNDRNSDGMMNDNYYGVLHGARAVGVPGLILEHSFHTNTKMTNWLLNDDNLEKLAKAEAEVIAEHFGLTKNETTSNKNVEDLLEVDGSWGRDTTLKTQQVFGTIQDGEISHQPTTYKDKLSKCKTSSWEFDDTRKGSQLIRAIQTFLKNLGFYTGKIDGLCEKKTVMAIQSFLASLGLYMGAIDGKMGRLTVSGWQMYINSRL